MDEKDCSSNLTGSPSSQGTPVDIAMLTPKQAGALVDEIHAALSLPKRASSSGGSLRDRWQHWRSIRLAAKGWQRLQRGDHGRALALCRKSLDTCPFCADARVLHARLALLAKAPDWYQAWVALAVLEQKAPPSSSVQHSELVRFVLLMILVNAERLFLEGENLRALNQIDEAYKVIPRDPWVLYLRCLILNACGRANEAHELIARLTGAGQKTSAQTAMAAIAGRIPRERATASSPISARRW